MITRRLSPRTSKLVWIPQYFSNLIDFSKSLDIQYFSMNAVDYADVRKFGRDCLEIQPDGLSAKIYGIPIRINRMTPRDVILSYDCSDAIISHVERMEFIDETDSSMSLQFRLGCFPHGAPPGCQLCSVQQVMNL